MKALTVLLVSLIFSSAHASWMSTKCSNSDGSVTWTYGDDENQINLKYANFVEGTLSLNIEQVDIHLFEEVMIENKDIKACSFLANRKVFAGKVKIRPASKHPEVLRGQFPQNRIDTEVICTTLTHEATPCKDDAR